MSLFKPRFVNIEGWALDQSRTGTVQAVTFINGMSILHWHNLTDLASDDRDKEIPSLYLLPRWKNRTDRALRWISVEFSATWQLHFHWNPLEHAVFSLAENVFGVDDFRPMRVQCLLNV